MAQFDRMDTNIVSKIHDQIKEIDFSFDITKNVKPLWARTRRSVLRTATTPVPFVPRRVSEVGEVGSFLPLRFGCFFNVEMQFDCEKMGYQERDHFLDVFDHWHKEVTQFLPWEEPTLARFERKSKKVTRRRFVNENLYHTLAVASFFDGSWKVRQASVVPDEDVDSFWDISQKWWIAHSPNAFQPDGIKRRPQSKSLKDGGYGRHSAIVKSLEEFGSSADHSSENRVVWSTPGLTPARRSRHVFSQDLTDRPSDYCFGWEMEEYFTRRGWNPAWIDHLLKA